MSLQHLNEVHSSSERSKVQVRAQMQHVDDIEGG